MSDRDLLTANEHRAVALAADLWNLLATIVGNGPSRNGDLSELAHHIHGIQRAVLKQAAARAYPDLYRLLGETLGERAKSEVCDWGDGSHPPHEFIGQALRRDCPGIPPQPKPEPAF